MAFFVSRTKSTSTSPEKITKELTILNRLGIGVKWLRCNPCTTNRSLLSVCRWGARHLPHLNIMTHSSELCPGTSPYWKNDADVDRHFKQYEAVFAWWQIKGIVPATLSEFSRLWMDKSAAKESPAGN